MNSSKPRRSAISFRLFNLTTAEHFSKLWFTLFEKRCRGHIGDFDTSLDRLLRSTGEDGGRLVIFLGGTIGDSTSEKRRSFLREMRSGLRSEDRLLVGVDLVKDPCVLKAVYDADNNRIEMWLHSRVGHEVHLEVPNFKVNFAVGEETRTEISAKFTRPSVERMFAEAKFDLCDWYTDEARTFGLVIGEPTAWRMRLRTKETGSCRLDYFGARRQSAAHSAGRGRGGGDPGGVPHAGDARHRGGDPLPAT